MSRELFEWENPEMCGDNIQIVADGDLHITVEEPWAGDTESGFGYTCNITLPKEQGIRLLEFLSRHYNATSLP